MSINNSREYLAFIAEDWGVAVTDHVLAGSKRQIAPGTYAPDDETGAIDSVTFEGTAGNDALFGGGGEALTFFLATRGRDLYGTTTFTEAYVDYSGAQAGVLVNMGHRGSRTYTDAAGASHTVEIYGRSTDGLGGIDYFARRADGDHSSVFGIFGSEHADIMIGPGDFFGGRGNDILLTWSGHGGEGDDKLIGRSYNGSTVSLAGDEGDDWIVGWRGDDVSLSGGDGNDRVFARGGDDYAAGGAGNDLLGGGAGDDYLEGGIGRDVILTGAGNDFINPDLRTYASPDPRDGARDTIAVTRHDLGAFTDRVQFGAFEADRDQVLFADAVRDGADYRVTYAGNAQTPGRKDTILQIDADGDGLGTTPDKDDYYLRVEGAELTLQNGYLLS